jgi:hypothetical protein
MTTFISNAFALSMIPDSATIRTRVVNLPAIAHKLANPVSIVGHADTAALFESMLGIPIAHNRATVTLTTKDQLYVGQMTGGRLPEGATTLPEGYEIKWICVTIDADPTPMERHWVKGGGSIYGAIDRQADEIAALVGGKVVLNADQWGNPHWDIEFNGGFATLHDD